MYLGNRELLKPCLASKPLETLHWHLAASCHELKELCSVAVVELLEYLPEELNWLRCCLVAHINCVFTEVIDIDGN